jgi:hypothetical protein
MSDPTMTDVPGDPRAIAPWLASGTLDAELAALAWLLVGTRVPLVVAGPPGTGRAALRDALGRLLPTDTTTAVLAGEREDFSWLPEAVELGWHRERSDQPTRHLRPPGETVLVAELDDAPGGTWGERARIAIRALSVGYAMLATVRGARLEDVFERLGGPPVQASEDELSRLGLVLVLDEGGRRVMAAHYLRPVARDAHGHVQRLPPAVVAARDPSTDRLEHFAWGIVPELADRIGIRPVELERQQARRAEILATSAREAAAHHD